MRGAPAHMETREEIPLITSYPVCRAQTAATKVVSVLPCVQNSPRDGNGSSQVHSQLTRNPYLLLRKLNVKGRGES